VQIKIGAMFSSGEESNHREVGSGGTESAPQVASKKRRRQTHLRRRKAP
jgi:hypothetical protein